MVGEQSQRDILWCRGDRGDLRDDVDAVLILVDHALNAAGLTFDATQARKVAGLVDAIAVFMVGAWAVVVGLLCCRLRGVHDV